MNVSNINYFDENRMDIVIKYLYVKAYIEQKYVKYFENLYLSSIKRINGGIEDDKKSPQDFLKKFNKLIKSIEKNGFNKKYPIPIGEDGILLNGAHRLAVCMYLNISPEVKYFKKKSELKFDINFFEKAGFKKIHIYRIINEYCKLKPNKNIFILWEPSKKYWKSIKSKISKSQRIVFQNQYRLNKKAMRNLIKDMYYYEFKHSLKNYINLKISNLEKYSTNSQILVIVTEPILNTPTIQIKNEIREKLHNKIPRELFITLHTNDNLEHSRYLINLLFNYNNIEYLNYISDKYSKKVEKKLLFLENFIQKNNINKEDICIDSGTVLEICGIRSSSDIDIIVKEKPKNIKKVPLVEIHNKNINSHKTNISDEEIIDLDYCHFYYKGFKCVNLGLIKLRKNSESKKEKIDIKLIENFLTKKKFSHLHIFEELNFKFKVFIYYFFKKTSNLLFTENQKKVLLNKLEKVGIKF
ncbi:MAG: hypothetical protein ACMXYB_04710 [Candidatus Woesearchaeota archaeon]